MRITKYRGKREDNGEWVYGAFYPIKDEDVYFIINNCKSIDFDDDDTTFNGYKVHKRSVGEFTGLHDKNGKDIYEGDILAKSNRSGWDLENFVAHEVFFHDNDMCESSIGFQMNRHHFQGSICGTNEYYKFIPKNTKQFEVIGNVFENPDLVKL